MQFCPMCLIPMSSISPDTGRGRSVLSWWAPLIKEACHPVTWKKVATLGLPPKNMPHSGFSVSVACLIIHSRQHALYWMRTGICIKIVPMGAPVSDRPALVTHPTVTYTRGCAAALHIGSLVLIVSGCLWYYLTPWEDVKNHPERALTIDQRNDST